ncbi:MAG: STAS domain-containing protein [Pyrinomonadaceae bacterium]
MLKIHTRNIGNVSVLCVQGRIVNGETTPLREAVNAQSTAGTVLLDLARVSTIDASGLGLMLELRRQSHANGIRFRLMNVTKLVRRVLEVTQLDSVFEIANPQTELLPAIPRVSAHRAMRFARCA